MNEMKSLVYLAGTLAVCGIIVGCSSTKSQAPVKKGTLTLMSDRGVIPPPFRSPQVVPISNVTAPRPDGVQGVVSQNDEPSSFDGGSEPDFVPADSTQPEATTPQYQSDYAKPEDASPTAVTVKQQSAKSNAPKRTYKIVKGDTLSDIAYMYQISWRDLAAENNLTEKSILREGQMLVLPESAAATPRPRQVRKTTSKPKAATTAKTQTNAKTASAAGEPAKSAGKANSAPKTAAQTLPADGIYTVVSGDSLWIICHRFGLKGDDVRALNPNVNFNNLQIGQKIKLPSGKGVEAPKPAAKNDTIKPLTPPSTSMPPVPDDPTAPKMLTPPTATQTTETTQPAAPTAEAAKPAEPAAEMPAQPKVTMPDLPQEVNEFAPNTQPANNAEPPQLP